MKRFFLVFCSSAVLPTIALAGPVEDMKAQYVKIDPYFLKMDAAGLTRAFQSMCAPGFLNINSEGKQTLPQIMKLIDGNFKTMKKVDYYRTTVGAIKVTGSTASMKASHRWIYELKSGHKIDFTEYVSDVWVKTPKGWKLQSETTVNQKVSVDGKRLNGPKAVAPASSTTKV